MQKSLETILIFHSGSLAVLECCWILDDPDRNVSRKKAGQMLPRIPCGKGRIPWLTVTFLSFAKLCWAISVWLCLTNRMPQTVESCPTTLSSLVLYGERPDLQFCEPLGWRPLARSLELWSWGRLFLISLLWPRSCQKSSLFLGRECVQSSQEVDPKINIAAILHCLLREKTSKESLAGISRSSEVYQYCSLAIPSAGLPSYCGCPPLTVHASTQSLTMS